MCLASANSVISWSNKVLGHDGLCTPYATPKMCLCKNILNRIIREIVFRCTSQKFLSVRNSNFNFLMFLKLGVFRTIKKESYLWIRQPDVATELISLDYMILYSCACLKWYEVNLSLFLQGTLSHQSPLIIIYNEQEIIWRSFLLPHALSAVGIAGFAL